MTRSNCLKFRLPLWDEFVIGLTPRGFLRKFWCSPFHFVGVPPLNHSLFTYLFVYLSNYFMVVKVMDDNQLSEHSGYHSGYQK